MPFDLMPFNSCAVSFACPSDKGRALYGCTPGQTRLEGRQSSHATSSFVHARRSHAGAVSA